MLITGQTWKHCQQHQFCPLHPLFVLYPPQLFILDNSNLFCKSNITNTTKVHFTLFACILSPHTHAHTHTVLLTDPCESKFQTLWPSFIPPNQTPSSHPRSFTEAQLCHLKYRPRSTFPSAQMFLITFYEGHCHWVYYRNMLFWTKCDSLSLLLFIC